MPFLGVTYKLAYEAKNFRSGLINVLAMVLKPDGSSVGPFTLSEITSAGFAGVYEYDFNTNSLSDPEGEYLAAIISPTDNVRDIHRFSLVHRPTGGGGSSSSQTPALVGRVSLNQVVGTVLPDPKEDGTVRSESEVSGQVSTPEDVVGVVKIDEIEGNL